MLIFRNTKGKVIMIEHDDGTREYLDEDMKKKAEEAQQKGEEA